MTIRWRSLVLVSALALSVSITAQSAEEQYLEDAKTALEQLVGRVTPEGTSTLENILDQLVTLETQLLVAANPPSSSPPPNANQAPTVRVIDPLDGTTLSTSATQRLIADATDPDGSITRVEFFLDGRSVGWDRDVPYRSPHPGVTLTAGTHVITAKAIDNQGNSTMSAPATVRVLSGEPTPTPSPTPVPPLPPASTGGGNGYFDALVKRPEQVANWPLRNQSQIDSLTADGVSRHFSYDPHMDAAKFVVQGPKPSASIPTKQQLLFRPPLVSNGTLLFVWDWYWGPEFLANRGSMNHYKTFKFKIEGDHSWWTLMNSPAWARTAPTTAASVAKVWDSGTTSGGTPTGLVRREPWTPAGPGTPDQRSGSGEQVNIEHGKWYRYIVEIRLFQPHTAFTEWNKTSGATLQPQAGDPQGRWHMVSKWIVDEQGRVQRLLYCVPFGWSANWSGLIGRFDFEMNTSQNDGFIGPLVGYGRNVVVLHNYQLPSVPETDSFLFQRPQR